MKWYKRLGALLLAAVLIVGLCQMPGKEAEASTPIVLKSFNITEKTLQGYGYVSGEEKEEYIITLSDDSPVMWDKKNNIIYLVYATLPDIPQDEVETDDEGAEEGGLCFDITEGVEIETEPENCFSEVFIYLSINSESTYAEIEYEAPFGYDDSPTDLILVSESKRPNLDDNTFEGEYPQITSFQLNGGNTIGNVSTDDAEVTLTQNDLTDEELQNEVVDAGTINIKLSNNIKAYSQVRIDPSYYNVKWGSPDDTYQSASVTKAELLWEPNKQAVYLNLNAKKSNGTPQTFRYKINLNIANYLYTSGDNPVFVSLNGFPTGIVASCDEEEGSLTLTTSKYLPQLSKMDIMPYYAAGAFCTSVIGGTLNGEPAQGAVNLKKNGSITPDDLNKGLIFTVQNAMGGRKEYTIQVKTPWALKWKNDINSQIKQILSDGKKQEKGNGGEADTWAVLTLEKGASVEVQLTPETGKVLDSVILKTSDGTQVENVTCKNGSFSFIMPDDVVILESLTWKDGSYHQVSINAKDTDGKDIDSKYCTATMKVGDTEDTMAAAGDTVVLTAKTEPHRYYEYQLDHWEYNIEALKDAQADEQAGTLTFTMPDQEVAVTPVYKKVGTQMTFGIKVPDGGSFRGYYGDGYYLEVDKTNQSYTDIYKPGATIQLLLDINSTGYRFMGWTDGKGNTWGEDAAQWSGNNATITVGEESQTWIAEFKAKTFAAVTLKCDTDEMGTVSGTYKGKEGTSFDSVFEGDQVTLKATPKKGYLFEKWQAVDEDGTEVTMPEGAGAETTFTMPDSDKDLTITAVFQADPEYKSDACEITNVELLDSDGKVVKAMTGQAGTTLTIALTKKDMSAEDAEGLAQSGKYYLRITHSDKATVAHRTFDDATNTIPGLAWNQGNVNCPIAANDSEIFTVTAADGTHKAEYTIKITYESEKPVISDIQVDRTSDSEAKVTFTSDTKGNYYWLYQKASVKDEPTQDDVLKSSLKGAISAGGSQTLTLKDLSNTAYKIFLVVKSNMNSAMPSDVTVIDIPKLGEYTIGNACSESGGTVSIDKTRADSGETITVTVTPKSGMKLDTLNYSTELAGSAPVSILGGKQSEGVYTFTMPSANITIGCTWSQLSESDGPTITGFVVNGTSGTISQSAGTIRITLPYGTDLTSLKPEITMKNAVSVSPASGTAVNLSAPVTYTVTAEDGNTKTYTVTATVAEQSSSDKLWEEMLKQSGGSTDTSGKNTWWQKAKDMKKKNNYPVYW